MLGLPTVLPVTVSPHFTVRADGDAVGEARVCEGVGVTLGEFRVGVGVGEPKITFEVTKFA